MNLRRLPSGKWTLITQHGYYLGAFKSKEAAEAEKDRLQGVFRKLRGTKDEVGSSKTSVVHGNPSGLDKKGCLEHVEAAKQGNAFVSMVGTDANDDELRGDNDDFSIRVKIGEAGMDFSHCLKTAFSRYRSLLDKGIVTVGASADTLKAKLKASFKTFTEGDADE